MELLAPERPPGARPGDPADRWNPWTAPLALLAGLAAALFFGVIVVAVGAAAGASANNPTAAMNIVSTIGQDLCFVGAALAMARRVAAPRPEQFGLRATAIGRAIALVVGGYILFLIVTALWTKALDIHEVDKLTKTLGAGRSNLALFAVGLITCVVAPICEEFLFRGYMYRALRNWRGVWPAALIIGLLFGLVHVASAPIGFLLPLAVFGVILCFVYEISDSLYPGIALHCVNNCLAFAAIEHARAGWYVGLVVGSLVTIAAVLSVAVRAWSALDDAEPVR